MVSVEYLAGAALAFSAALSSAVQALVIRKGTEKGSTYDAVIIVVLVNLVVLTPVVFFLYYPNFGFTPISVVSFVAAGFVGTILGRVFYFTSINKIGASRTIPIVASHALIATLLGMLFLDETITAIHGVGVVLIVAGVAAISWETSRDSNRGLTRKEVLRGLFIPFGAALAFGLEPIFANFGLSEGTPPISGLLLKSIVATVGFLGYLRWRNALPRIDLIGDANNRLFILAGIVNTFFLLGYYGALEIAPVNVVVPILSTNTLLVVVLSMLFMPSRLEEVSLKIVVSAVVVVSGVIMISVSF